jgi:hypothetical protein
MGAMLMHPLLAIGLGVLFGLVRGLAVYLAADLDSGQKLARFHARFEGMRESVRRGMIVIQALVAIIATATASGVGRSVVIGALAVTIVVIVLRGPREKLGPAVSSSPAGAWS